MPMNVNSMQFTIVDSFTKTPFTGNPAAVIVLSPDHPYNDAVLQNIALEFNLSETAFITPIPHPRNQTTSKEKSADDIISNPKQVDGLSSVTTDSNKHPTFAIRWFTPTEEAPICGHATLASAAVLFTQPDLLNLSDEIHFISSHAGRLVCRKVPGDADAGLGTKIELVFPAGNVTCADEETTQKAREALKRATGDIAVDPEFVGVDGSAPYDPYILLEISSEVDLKSLEVDTEILGTLYPPYGIAVISQRSRGIDGSEGKGRFNTRVFSGPTGTPEDPVTGSACSFAAKHWATKEDMTDGEVMSIHQVSSRGGIVEVVFDSRQDDGMTVKLRGECRFSARGEIYI